MIRNWMMAGRPYAIVAALVCVIATGNATTHAQTPRWMDVPGGYSSEHILVRLAPHADGAEAALKSAQQHDSFHALVTKWKVTDIRPLYTKAFVHPDLAQKLGLDRLYVVETSANTDTITMAREFGAIGGVVEHAEADGMGEVAALYPDDIAFGLQWGMHNDGSAGMVEDADIDAPEAWDVTTGTPGAVTVAVIDSGVSEHPDLDDRIIGGFNAFNPETPEDYEDDCDHGTHVAGTIGARGNNAQGVAGVNWEASILAVRVVSPCSGLESHCAAGIIWAADNGADICNMSLQYYAGTETLRSAVRYAYELGVLMIAAAGNDRNQVHLPGNSAFEPTYTVAYPGKYPEVMAVSAMTKYNERWSRSNYGPETEITAPGEDIWSTSVDVLNGHNPRYITNSGTSMATPHVSGIASLVMTLEPDLPGQNIRYLMRATADEMGPLGWDREHGDGRANAYAAILASSDVNIVTASYPPHLAIDARQPSALDGSEPAGWQVVELSFEYDPSAITADDFKVYVQGADAEPPQVASVASIAPFTLAVTLDAPIPPGAWTTLVHADSGSAVRLGFLPGDVDGNGEANALDVVRMIEVLNAEAGLHYDWSIDVDRSGSTTPADLLRVIDLLNGADAYDLYQGVALP